MSSPYQASANGRVWLATWKTGVTAWSTNADQAQSRAGSDSRRPSTSAGGMSANRMPPADSRASSPSSQTRSRKVTWPTGCSRPAPAAAMSPIQRFHARMLANVARRSSSRGRSHAIP